MSLDRLERALADVAPRVIACSGGVDSLVLATVAARQHPDGTMVAHAVTPAVPAAATARVHAVAAREGWQLETVTPGEFDDERYLANPVDRCFYCKEHLYLALDVLADRLVGGDRTLMSGANLDDLGEYRPGLEAAAARGVRHPFVEAEIDKPAVRSIARELGLEFADLPASPCLASRIYTGTRVSVERLRAIDLGEELIRARLGIGVVRCRVRDDSVIVEVESEHRALVDPSTLAATLDLMRTAAPQLESITLDDGPYRPGRAFVVTAST